MTIERPMFPPRAAAQDSLKRLQPSDGTVQAVEATHGFPTPTGAPTADFEIEEQSDEEGVST